MLNDLPEIRKNRAIAYLNDVWQPHDGQIKAGQAIFQDNAKMIYIECGRKFGKSEFSVYLCWMYAILNPNSEVYYLAPAVKLAKELVWSNFRMQTCNSYDRNFLTRMEKILGGKIEVSKQEMRIILPNGSFIKVDGSDNIDSQLGLKPDLIIADEMRTFKEEWLEFATPNLAAKDGTLVCISTPPLGPNRAYEHALECKTKMKAGNPRYFYLNLPSETNNKVPHLKQWLKEEKERLYGLGRENEWRREYMAEYITSNEHAIIPQLSRNSKNRERRDKMLQKVRKSKALDLYLCINPANSTFLGSLLMAVDRNTGNVYVLAEHIEHDSQKTAATTIWPAITDGYGAVLEKIDKTLDDVTLLCPPTTPWFRRDMHEQFDLTFEDVDKECNKPEHNIGLVKDLLLSGKMHISKDCEALIKESETYIRNQRNYSIPKDDKKVLIYCLRGILHAMGYTSDLIELPEERKDDEKFLERITSAKSFELRMRELRMEKYGILIDDEETLFMDDVEFLEP